MILILTASPEKDGLTATTAKVFEQCLDNTEVICLNNLDLHRCTACGKRGWGICLEQGICCHDPVYNALQEKILASKVLIVITPVYFHEMSESCKLVFDKLKRCLSFNKEKNLQGKKSVFVACAGGSGSGTDNTIEMFKLANYWLKTNVIATFGINHDNKIQQFEDIKIQMKELNNHE